MDEQAQLKKIMSDLDNLLISNSTLIKKLKIDPMDNIEYSIEVINGRKKLIVEIDLDKALSGNNPLTNKGNSYQVATTGGFHEIGSDFPGLLMSLNVTYDKKTYDQKWLENLKSNIEQLNTNIAITNKMLENISSPHSEQQPNVKLNNSQSKAKVKSSKETTKLKPSWKNKSSKRTMRCRSCYYFNTQNFCAVNSKTMEPNDSCDKHRGVRPTIYNGGRASGK